MMMILVEWKFFPKKMYFALSVPPIQPTRPFSNIQQAKENCNAQNLPLIIYIYLILPSEQGKIILCFVVVGA